MPNELQGYWCCGSADHTLRTTVLDFSETHTQIQCEWVSALRLKHRGVIIFSCSQRSRNVGSQERVWATAWPSWASSEEICDANDLLVFSWEQKGFQYGEPNRIHYLTISSKLMQDCAARMCSKEEGPWQLEMGRKRHRSCWMQRWHFPSLPAYRELREGPVPTWRPSPIPLPPDLALSDPNQRHPEWTWSPSALAPAGLFFRRLPRACPRAGCGYVQNETQQDEAH